MTQNTTDPKHTVDARPANYKPLLKGVRCRCPRLWRDADGSYWCCLPSLQTSQSQDPRVESIQRHINDIEENGFSNGEKATPEEVLQRAWKSHHDCMLALTTTNDGG